MPVGRGNAGIPLDADGELAPAELDLRDVNEAGRLVGLGQVVRRDDPLQEQADAEVRAHQDDGQVLDIAAGDILLDAVHDERLSVLLVLLDVVDGPVPARMPTDDVEESYLPLFEAVVGAFHSPAHGGTFPLLSTRHGMPLAVSERVFSVHTR